MKYQVCRGCGDHLDAGEAVNGYCRDCLEEKEKERTLCTGCSVWWHPKILNRWKWRNLYELR